MLLNCDVGEDSWKPLGLQGDPINPSWRRSVLNIHWKDWYGSWNSNTLATWFEELTHWKRPWCWERLKARGEGDDRGWDGWMASPTWWMWVWASSWSWWGTGNPGVVQFISWQSQTGLSNWTELQWMSRSQGRSIPWIAGGSVCHIFLLSSPTYIRYDQSFIFCQSVKLNSLSLLISFTGNVLMEHLSPCTDTDLDSLCCPLWMYL